MRAGLRAARWVLGGLLDYRRHGADGVRSREVVFLAMAKFGPLASVSRGGLTYLVSTADGEIGGRTFVHGGCDLDAMRSAVEIVEGAGFEVRGSTFVDVGANIGTTTVPAIRMFGASRVIAVEPGPENFRLLRCNVILNDLDGRVRCVEAAASEREGTATLELSAVNSGDHRVRVTAATGLYDEAERSTVMVRQAPLDDLLSGDEIAGGGLLWLDTQGFEGHILVGAQRIAGWPVVAEYWPYGLERTGGLDLFHSIVASRYRRIVDVRTGTSMPPGEVANLREEYPAPAFTELVLLP